MFESSDPSEDLRIQIDKLIYDGIGLSSAQPQAVQAIVDELDALLSDSRWGDKPYVLGQAGTALLRGLTSMHNLDYVASFQHAERALTLYQQLDDPTGLARAYYWRGILNRRTHQLSQALDDMLQALEQARRVNNYRLTCNMLNGLASIYMIFADYLNALKVLEDAIELARQHEDSWVEIVTMSNAAHQYIQAGQVAKGLEYARQSADYLLAHDVGIMAIWSLNNVALALRRLGQHDEALHTLQQAHALALQVQSEEKRLDVLLSLAETYLELQQLDQAIRYFEEALALEAAQPDDMLIVDAYKHLAECYRQQGDYERAYTTISIYYERRIKAYNVEAESKMALLQARMEAENAQRLAQAEHARAEALERIRQQDLERFQHWEELRLDLLRTIVHDAKSPLSTISLALDILRRHLKALENPVSDAERAAIDRQLGLIARANEAITQLINETMASARQKFNR